MLICGIVEIFGQKTISIACYLVNRSPHTSIDSKIPEELWLDNPVNYSILRVFGCTVFAHVNKAKLALRSTKCIFLGYASESKGYRLWCPNSKKVIQSRDINFNENVMFLLEKEFAILIGNLQDDSEKVELEVPSYAPQGGDSVPHSSSEDHI